MGKDAIERKREELFGGPLDGDKVELPTSQSIFVSTSKPPLLSKWRARGIRYIRDKGGAFRFHGWVSENPKGAKS